MISRSRIGNWARWTRSSRSTAHSMTAIVCDSMRRNALGEVWAGHSGAERVDESDALLVERAWKAQMPLHRDLLRWHYIQNAPIAFTCRRLKIKQWPASAFALALAAAEAALNETLVGIEKQTGK